MDFRTQFISLHFRWYPKTKSNQWWRYFDSKSNTDTTFKHRCQS